MSLHLAEKSRRVGKSGFLITELGLNVYLEPRETEDDLPKANIIFLTVADPKLLPLRDVRRLSTPETIVVGLAAAVSKFTLNQLPVIAGQSHQVLGIKFEAHEGKDKTLRYVLNYPEFSVNFPED